jgi:uncharacterized membrane protein
MYEVFAWQEDKKCAALWRSQHVNSFCVVNLVVLPAQVLSHAWSTESSFKFGMRFQWKKVRPWTARGLAVRRGRARMSPTCPNTAQQ